MRAKSGRRRGRKTPVRHQSLRIAREFSPCERIVLHRGDALSFLKRLPSGLISLAVTSPPYNMGKKYERRQKLDEYLRGQEEVIEQLVRVLKPNGSICWQVGNFVKNGEVFPLDIFYYELFKKKGLHLRSRIVWHFGHGLHAKRRFSGRYETILWFSKGDEYVFNIDSIRVRAKYPGKTYYKGKNKGKPSGNPLGKNPSDVWRLLRGEWKEGVWDIPNVKANHPEKTMHPCQFPVELVERCVLALTNEKDWVLDPYSGVGSTLIAAIKHRRRTIGCERERVYVNTAKRRIRDLATGRLRMRKIGTPVHQPSGRERVAQYPKAWKRRYGKGSKVK